MLITGPAYTDGSQTLLMVNGAEGRRRCSKQDQLPCSRRTGRGRARKQKKVAASLLLCEVPLEKELVWKGECVECVHLDVVIRTMANREV
jgi:hypothetical protein